MQCYRHLTTFRNDCRPGKQDAQSQNGWSSDGPLAQDSSRKRIPNEIVRVIRATPLRNVGRLMERFGSLYAKHGGPIGRHGRWYN